MTERPILFSAPMVRAILAGSKTQTRRPVAFPRSRDAFVVVDHGGWWPYQSDDGESQLCDDGMEHPYACPYGKPGDRLWVRENGWERPERTPRMMREGADTWAPYYYDADGISDAEAADLKAWGFTRRPSIHMPRKACRILLEVTGVRVERLHAITEADAIAEGVERTVTGDGWRWYADEDSELAGLAPRTSAIDSYRTLWEHLGGAGSWRANPWVWAIEFRKLP